ncbi:uncharacterized protein LOC120352382 [Nilaparvata lugens]|uniref:uncharacterized protein LOC120352382 n=1 Tax=Nilaparvata lugens TaxID=108931 RepID=UPI00193CB997|nr:uncharacterized protein LOC120352382 [Nilaparvata lugens]
MLQGEKNSNFFPRHGTTRAPTSLSTSFRFHFLTSQHGFRPNNQLSSSRGNIPERLTSNLKRKHTRYLHLCSRYLSFTQHQPAHNLPSCQGKEDYMASIQQRSVIA